MHFKGKVRGMTCTSCEKIIMRTLEVLPGVNKVRADYTNGDIEVWYDSRVGPKDFAKALSEKGYFLEWSDVTEFFGIRLSPAAAAFSALVLLLGIYFILSGMQLAELPEVDSNAGLAVLFLFGLLTSVHCIAMCGGFVVSYSTACAERGERGILPHLKYGIGKLFSYTIIGAIFGLLGSFIAITLEMRAAAAIIAGLFLLVFGLNMLNIYPPLRKLMPQLPNLGNRLIKGNSSPLLVGLANGLFIACGPLQAMYVLAAGTGSPLNGGLALFTFGLGTLPAMLGFGVFASKLTWSMRASINKFSGVLVLFLAIMMLNNGFVLLGSGFSAASFGSLLTADTSPQNGLQSVANAEISDKEGAVVDYQEAVMEVNAYGYSPNRFIVKKGIPVKWIINTTQLTGCNKEIIMREYGIDLKLQKGVQTVEFTPNREGTVQFSCWMGMIQGEFIVVSSNSSKELTALSNKTQLLREGRSCGCGGR